MKLQQGQLWKCQDAILRIVRLERMVVLYKAMPDLETEAGVHHRVSKKEFCRLIKTAVLTLPILPSGPEDAEELP